MKKVIVLLLTVAMTLTMTGCIEEMLTDMIGSAIDKAINDSYVQEEPETEPINMVELLPQTESIRLEDGEFHEEGTYSYYLFHGVTEAQALEFDAKMQELPLSYSPQGDQVDDDEPYFLNHYTADDRSFFAKVCFYKDTMLLIYGTYLPWMGNIQLLAGVPEELVPAELIWNDDRVHLDIDAGTVEERDGYLYRTITDVTWQDCHDYGEHLLYGGYTWENQATDASEVYQKLYINGLMKEGMGDLSYIVIAYYNGTAKVMTSSERFTFDEAALWNDLNAPVSPGLIFLQEEADRVKVSLGGGVGSGSGMSTTGHVYYNHYKANRETFDKALGQLKAEGFVEEANRIDNGEYQEYSAYRPVTYGGLEYHFWAQLILEGEYCEVEYGFDLLEGTHKD